MSNWINGEEWLPDRSALALCRVEKNQDGWVVEATAPNSAACPECGVLSTARYSESVRTGVGTRNGWYVGWSLMICPHCQSPQTVKLNRTTELGYAVFHCGACQRKWNERTGTPFNYLGFPTDIVFQVVLFRLRYKLSLRDLAEMFLLRGFEFTHEAVREWEERFAPLLAEYLRHKRKGKVGSRWYADETYLRVKGQWCYLYRAIDREGNLVDSMLSATRDMAAAQQFFRGSLAVVDKRPRQVTSDGHYSYPRAIREVLGPNVDHRCSAYLNRRIEQDHRGIKQRYYPMLGFGAFHSAQRFCRAFEEIRQYFRPRRKRKEFISLALRRRQFITRAQALESMFLAA